MKRNTMSRAILSALIVGLLCTSCVGPFHATRRIHTWNREFDNRWAGEGIFLVFRALPVYSIAAVGDLLIFNSMKFWGWENPIDPPDKERIAALNKADDDRAAAAAEEDDAADDAEG